MSPRTSVVAALALVARGISAIGPYSDGATTVTGEPQLVGSATSNSVLLYSFNYCTTVQSTACAVTVATSASPTPEYSTLSTLVEGATTITTVAVPISWPSASGGSSETATPSAASTDDSSAHWTPDPAITHSASPDMSIPTTDGQTSPTVVVIIPTTDASGSSTLLTSTVVATSSTTAWLMTSSSSSSTSLTSVSSSSATSSSRRSSSSRTTTSATSSSTGGASNATLTSTEEASSATLANHAAPSKTGSGASLHVIPVIVLGAAVFMTAIFLI